MVVARMNTKKINKETKQLVALLYVQNALSVVEFTSSHLMLAAGSSSCLQVLNFDSPPQDENQNYEC